MKKWLSLFFVTALVFLTQASAYAERSGVFASLSSGNKAVFESAHVRAELVVYAPQGVVAGQDVWLGVKIEQPWRCGDGNPTQLDIA